MWEWEVQLQVVVCRGGVIVERDHHVCLHIRPEYVSVTIDSGSLSDLSPTGVVAQMRSRKLQNLAKALAPAFLRITQGDNLFWNGEDDSDLWSAIPFFALT